jgi:hypothetical protein
VYPFGYRDQERSSTPVAYREDFSLPEGFLEQICEQGLDGIGEAIRIVVNAAMQAERERHVNAGL